MLFTGREVRIGRNCAQGLENGPRPAASGRIRDHGHSFSVHGFSARGKTVSSLMSYFFFVFAVFWLPLSCPSFGGCFRNIQESQRINEYCRFRQGLRNAG